MLKMTFHSLIMLALAAILAAAPLEPAEARHRRCRGIGFVESFARAISAAILAPFPRYRVVRHRHKPKYQKARRQSVRKAQQTRSKAQKQVAPASPPPQQCSWEGRTCFTNEYGDQVCTGGTYVCK